MPHLRALDIFSVPVVCHHRRRRRRNVHMNIYGRCKEAINLSRPFFHLTPFHSVSIYFIIKHLIIMSDSVNSKKFLSPFYFPFDRYQKSLIIPQLVIETFLLLYIATFCCCMLFALLLIVWGLFRNLFRLKKINTKYFENKLLKIINIKFLNSWFF